MRSGARRPASRQALLADNSNKQAHQPEAATAAVKKGIEALKAGGVSGGWHAHEREEYRREWRQRPRRRRDPPVPANRQRQPALEHYHSIVRSRGRRSRCRQVTHRYFLGATSFAPRKAVG